MGDSKIMNMRVPVEDKAAWEEEAYRLRISLSKWIRDTCNAALGGSSVPVPPIHVYQPEGRKKPKAVAAEMIHRGLSTVTAECSNRVPKGSFCKRCGRTH